MVDGHRKNLLCSISKSKWSEILDNYGYPKRPCDTKCVDGCSRRPSCPLYTAWEARQETEAQDEGAEK